MVCNNNKKRKKKCMSVQKHIVFWSHCATVFFEYEIKVPAKRPVVLNLVGYPPEKTRKLEFYIRPVETWTTNISGGNNLRFVIHVAHVSIDYDQITMGIETLRKIVIITTHIFAVYNPLIWKSNFRLRQIWHRVRNSFLQI